jgi:hypothetical protein
MPARESGGRPSQPVRSSLCGEITPEAATRGPTRPRRADSKHCCFVSVVPPHEGAILIDPTVTEEGPKAQAQAQATPYHMLRYRGRSKGVCPAGYKLKAHLPLVHQRSLLRPEATPYHMLRYRGRSKGACPAGYKSKACSSPTLVCAGENPETGRSVRGQLGRWKVVRSKGRVPLSNPGVCGREPRDRAISTRSAWPVEGRSVEGARTPLQPWCVRARTPRQGDQYTGQLGRWKVVRSKGRPRLSTTAGWESRQLWTWGVNPRKNSPGGIPEAEFF